MATSYVRGAYLTGLFAISGFPGGASGSFFFFDLRAMLFWQFSVTLSHEFLARFLFDHIFCQVFDQIFGQDFDQSLGEGKNIYNILCYLASRNNLQKPQESDKTILKL